jgi:uncharacterized protein Smg (DUF494 family)
MGKTRTRKLVDRIERGVMEELAKEMAINMNIREIVREALLEVDGSE